MDKYTVSQAAIDNSITDDCQYLRVYISNGEDHNMATLKVSGDADMFTQTLREIADQVDMITGK